MEPCELPCSLVITGDLRDYGFSSWAVPPGFDWRTGTGTDIILWEMPSQWILLQNKIASKPFHYITTEQALQLRTVLVEVKSYSM